MGSAVFKTVSRALVPVLGGFDSHAPPPTGCDDIKQNYYQDVFYPLGQTFVNDPLSPRLCKKELLRCDPES